MASGLVNVFSEEQFSFNGKNVRSFYVNGEPLLMAKDVCLAIGYSKKAIHHAIEAHVPSKYKLRFSDIKGTVDLTIPSNVQPEQILLKEPGLYCLLLRSKKDEAEPFMDWVAETVLPREVRKLNEEHQAVIEDKDNALTLLNDELDESQRNIAILERENAYEIQAKDHEIQQLQQRYVDHCINPSKDNVIIIIRKHTKEVDDKLK